MSTASATQEMPVVLLEVQDLPAYCPNKTMALWNQHPRCSSTWPPPVRLPAPTAARFTGSKAARRSTDTRACLSPR